MHALSALHQRRSVRQSLSPRYALPRLALQRVRQLRSMRIIITTATTDEALCTDMTVITAGPAARCLVRAAG
jgi:K+ transporter